MTFVKVLKAQADLGLDVVTDGEMERGAYYMQVKLSYAGQIQQSKYQIFYILHIICTSNRAMQILYMKAIRTFKTPAYTKT